MGDSRKATRKCPSDDNGILKADIIPYHLDYPKTVAGPRFYCHWNFRGPRFGLDWKTASVDLSLANSCYWSWWVKDLLRLVSSRDSDVQKKKVNTRTKRATVLSESITMKTTTYPRFVLYLVVDSESLTTSRTRIYTCCDQLKGSRSPTSAQRPNRTRELFVREIWRGFQEYGVSSG